MKEILNKISSYNIFNYLFPGILLAAATDKVCSISLVVDDPILGLFVYYFYGMIISRFGSLVVEPILKKTKFVKPEPYPNYIKALKKDQKIDELSQENNTYRTLASLSILFLLFLVIDQVSGKALEYKAYIPYVLTIVLSVIFIFSYRKQTNYIASRIRKTNSEE